MSNMYTRAFKAPAFHNGKRVKNTTLGSYDQAGPGIDGIEPTNSSTGEVIQQWLDIDPNNRSMMSLKNMTDIYASRRGSSARVSYQMIRTYVKGTYTPVYKTKKITVAEFPKWYNDHRFFLLNTRMKSFKFEVQRDGFIEVPVFEAGKRVVKSYNWRCCNPKKINGELLASAMGMLYHEAAGYSIASMSNFKAVSDGIDVPA